MSSVDNRLVKMTFDNADFEKKAGTTLGTLDKLKQSLDFTGALKGMDNIQSGVNSVTFDRISEGIEALKSRFSVLGEFVHNTFSNILNTAVNTGKQLATALTIDPIKDGFAEYETQMNSVQTILGNVRDEGKGLSDVTKALDELNTYADKTIYNFTEMTRNIGTFTAAGVDLDTSVNAIQGIANLAAVSGASSQDASRAMYQLSQALAAGVVHLQDWNSVQNANIGGEAFQKAIKETAVLRGALTQEQIDTAGSFRALLNAKDYGDWFSADILLESLEKFTAGSEGITEEQLKQMQELYRARGYTEEQIKSLTEAQHVLTEEEEKEIRQKWKDKGYNDEQIDGIMELGRSATDAATKVKTFHQLIDTVKETLGSGWTKSFEYVVGDFEKAKELWTEINDILSIYINASADARNATLKEWNEGGGRAAIIDGLRNAFQGLLGVILPVKQAFNEFFPAIDGKELIKRSNDFKNFTETLKVTDEEAAKIRETARKFFEILRTGFDATKNLATTFWEVLKAVFEGIKGALDFNSILNTIEMVVERFKAFTEAIKPSEENLNNLKNIVQGVVSVLRAIATVAVNAGSALFDGLGKVFIDLAPHGQHFMDLLGQIGEWLSKLAEKLEQTFNYEAFAGGIGSMTSALGHFLDQILQFTKLDTIIDKIKEFFTVGENGEHSFDILNGVADFLGKIIEKISGFVSQIDLSKIDFFAILQGIFSTAAIKKVYDLINEIYQRFTKGTEEAPKLLDNIKAYIEDFVNKFVENLNIIKNSLVDTLTALQTSVNSTAMLKIAAALGILVLSLAKLSEIDRAKLMGAMIALTALMGEITVMTQTLAKIQMENFGSLTKIGTAMVEMAGAVYILSKAVKDLAEVDPEALGRGLAAITALIVEITLVAEKFAKIQGSLDKSVKSLIAFAGAVWILGKVVKDLAEVDPERLGPAMLALTGLLAELTGVAIALSNSKLMQKPEQLSTIAKGLVIFAAAVKVLVMSVKDLGEMDTDKLIAGIAGVTGLIIELGGVAILLSNSKLMQKPDQLTKIGLGLVIFAGAVKVLVMSVKDLGDMDTDKLVAGIAGITGLIVELGVVAAVFSNEAINPAKIAATSAALLVFAVAMGAITLSMTALAAIGLPGIAVALIAMAGAIGIFAGAAILLEPVTPAMYALAGAMLLFGAGLGAIGLGIGVAAAGLALLVATIAAAGFSIPEIIKAILSAIGQLGEALANMIVGFITTIAEHGPQLVEAVSQIIANILLSIQQNVPLIVETLLSTLTQLLEQFAQYVPRMAEAGLQIIGGFLQAIANNLPQILESAITIAVEFIRGIAEKLPDIIDAAFKLIIGFIDGLASAIEENHMALFEAIGHLIRAIVEAIIDGIGMVADAGGKLIFGEDGNGGLVGAIGGFFKDLFNAGANLVKGFIDGILSMPKQLWDAACSVAQSAWDAITHTLDEHSPSRVTFDGGQNFTQGFIDGMGSLDDEVRAASAGVACSALDALEQEMGEEELYSPRIRPVLDTEELGVDTDSALSKLNSLPDSNSINGTLRADRDLMRRYLEKDAAKNNDTQAILNAINSTKNDQELGIEEFSRMKVVLDSGALVGHLAPALDQEMGTRQILAGRGVI